ncbi:MAG: protein-glutamate O-methyltransferase CheR [Proteobacteria bacterium]|nr:protein-glutamate O-methyltransferase CheR [Pseudomonadota bacterium]
MEFNVTLTRYLKSKGFTIDEINSLFKKTTAVVLSNPDIDPENFVIQLSKLGWKQPALDKETSSLLLKEFIDSGLFTSNEREGPDDLPGLNRLLEKIHRERGLDFRGYARSSLIRRIANRLQATNAVSYDRYEQVLDSNEQEYDFLLDELTVTFTHFMRDKEAFAALEKAIGQMIRTENKKGITIWSAGCATGQEPYSIAMLLADGFPETGAATTEIIATDIDNKAMQFAKRGLYDPGNQNDIPDSWLKYFVTDRNKLQVKEDIKTRVQFRYHNLTVDKPVVGTDIICCRNVLIYFNLVTQLRVINRFYQSLAKSGGYLLLGRYEMLTKEARSMFSCIDFDARLYKRRK